MGQSAEPTETSAERPLSRKRRQTQTRLLDAALDAFAERGFQGTSVEEICERAGFSRGAFYSNYSSKTELFIALYHRQSETILGALAKRASPSGQPVPHDLETVVRQILAAVPHDRRWYLINTEFALHAVRNPSAAATFAAARGRVRTIFAESLTEVLGRMDLELTVPAEDLARWLWAMSEGGTAQSYMEPQRLAPNDLIMQVAPLLLGAVTKPS
ncbi:TetR/AcrR family transcriptional regulator [Actinophytocola sp.]|uniref:TetR/AcrR family transcriptional regulator n=1 Tax=Actinophytocola sp. TaxID=1872138 RepID=UPI002ED0BF2D